MQGRTAELLTVALGSAFIIVAGACGTEPSVAPIADGCEGSLPLTAIAPAYAVPLRVHVTRSGHSREALCGILREMNVIWWTQAGICFDIEVVTDDVKKSPALELWFEASAPFPDGTDANGVFVTRDEMYVLDQPQLRDVDRPVTHPAARTAAHEVGHALGLSHQNCGAACDELLMRSGTKGWRLANGAPANGDELSIVRSNVARGQAPALVGDMASCSMRVPPM